MKISYIFFCIAFLLLFSSVWWLASVINSQPSVPPVTKTIPSINSASPSATISTMLPAPSPTASTNIPVTWIIYSSPLFNFSLQHPPSIEVKAQKDLVHFFEAGPTQVESMEFFDGISVSISRGIFEGDTFADFVTQQWQQAKDAPETEKITPLDAVTIASMRGYQFTTNGLGTFRQIYLPIKGNHYFYITDSTLDPTNQGYENIVTMMLNSIEMEDNNMN